MMKIFFYIITAQIQTVLIMSMKKFMNFIQNLKKKGLIVLKLFLKKI